MNGNVRKRSTPWAGLRWLVVAAFIVAALFSGLFKGLMHRAGGLYLVLGSIAAALMGFSTREIGAAFRAAAGRPASRDASRRAAYFWEAAARNAWILGVLGSLLNFTIVLGVQSSGIEDQSARMIQAMIISLYGLILAVVCLVPAMKIGTRLEGEASAEATFEAGALPARPDRSSVFGRIFGYVLFAAALASTVYFMSGGQPQNGVLPFGKVFLQVPSILVIAGGTAVLALFMGSGARALTLGFAMTGFISFLAGFIQALLGFTHRNIQTIAAAISFMISASLFALLGLGVIAAPLEDREAMGRRLEGPGALSRMFWIVFPLLALIFLVLIFIMIVTPMKQKAGG